MSLRLLCQQDSKVTCPSNGRLWPWVVKLLAGPYCPWFLLPAPGRRLGRLQALAGLVAMGSRCGEAIGALLPLPSVAEMPANLTRVRKQPATFIKCVFTSSSRSCSTKHSSPAVPDSAQPAARPGHAQAFTRGLEPAALTQQDCCTLKDPFSS